MYYKLPILVADAGIKVERIEMVPHLAVAGARTPDGRPVQRALVAPAQCAVLLAPDVAVVVRPEREARVEVDAGLVRAARIVQTGSAQDGSAETELRAVAREAGVGAGIEGKEPLGDDDAELKKHVS